MRLDFEGCAVACASPNPTCLWIQHVLRGCGPCLDGFLLASDGREATEEEEEEYDQAIDRALNAVHDRMRAEARALVAAGGLEALADAPEHLEGRFLLEALIERVRELRYEDPSQMVELAEVAAGLAEMLRPQQYGPERVADLQLLAWTELGNAYRVADNLDRSEEAFNRAILLLIQNGRRDQLITARFFDVFSDLSNARRFYDTAITTVHIAETSYRRKGKRHLAGRAMIKRGMFTGYNGEPEEAIRLIREGLSFADQTCEPALRFSALHNQARLLRDCGRYREAKDLLSELKKRKLEIGGRINDLKVRWLEGQISVGLHEFESAERAFRQVKEGFAEANLPYKEALVGLELGALLLDRGRITESEEVTLAALDVFEALRIGPEARKALFLLRMAFEMQAVTVALIERVARFLHRAEHDPQVKFEETRP